MWIDEAVAHYQTGEITGAELRLSVLVHLRRPEQLPQIIARMPRAEMKVLVKEARTVHRAGYRAKPRVSCVDPAGQERRHSGVIRDLNHGYRLIYQHFYLSP